MKKDVFDDLVASIREAGKIKRGKRNPSRIFRYKPTDVKKVRARFGMSQSEFAMLLGVSVATLQNWEQGRRRPEGPACALLRIAEKNPEAVVDALRD